VRVARIFDHSTNGDRRCQSSIEKDHPQPIGVVRRDQQLIVLAAARWPLPPSLRGDRHLEELETHSGRVGQTMEIQAMPSLRSIMACT
jgi:hypothetical protein